MSNFNGRRWTPEENALLRAALDAPNRPSVKVIARQLAQELGRTVDATESRLWWVLNGGRPSRAGKDSKPRADDRSVYRRRCLGCRTSIEDRSPFIRMCDACKKTPAWRAGIHG